MPGRSRRPPSKKAVKAAADRAEARSRGDEPSPIDPELESRFGKREDGGGAPAAEVIPPAETKPRLRKPPTPYTPGLAADICEHLAEGFSLRSYCADPDAPSLSSVFRWLGEHVEFREQYARAREEQAEAHADAIVFIADTEPDPAVAKVRIDARKWVAAKLKPRTYGDFKQVDVTTDGQSLNQNDDKAKLDLARWIAFRLSQAPAKRIEHHEREDAE